VREALRVEELVQARVRGVEVERAAAEQVRQQQPLPRGVRVERELRVQELDVVLAGDAVGTDRTEVAPGSDVVGEDFQDRRAHVG